MNYKPLKVTILEMHGLDSSLAAMRLPKNQPTKTTKQDDLDLGSKLVKAGTDHAKFTRGIIAWMSLELQVGFMIEFETYRHGVECLSTSSSMHNELSRLSGPELAEAKQNDLPGKVYTRVVMVSYQALRAIYRARKNHRHPDWQIFCDVIERLPYFDSLIYPEVKEEKNDEQ